MNTKEQISFENGGKLGKNYLEIKVITADNVTTNLNLILKITCTVKVNKKLTE